MKNVNPDRTDSMNDRLITTKELANRWSITPQALVEWRRKKEGPPYLKIGIKKKSPVLYRMTDVLKYEERMTHGKSRNHDRR